MHSVGSEGLLQDLLRLFLEFILIGMTRIELTVKNIFSSLFPFGTISMRNSLGILIIEEILPFMWLNKSKSTVYFKSYNIH